MKREEKKKTFKRSAINQFSQFFTVSVYNNTTGKQD